MTIMFRLEEEEARVLLKVAQHRGTHLSKDEVVDLYDAACRMEEALKPRPLKETKRTPIEP